MISYIANTTLGEIRKGIELLRKKSPEKCIPLQNWLEKLHSDYANCTIPITAEISERWGELSLQRSLPEFKNGMVYQKRRKFTRLRDSLSLA